VTHQQKGERKLKSYDISLENLPTSQAVSVMKSKSNYQNHWPNDCNWNENR